MAIMVPVTRWGPFFMGGISICAGDKFGQLTTKEKTHKFSKSGRKRTHWFCSCECGGLAVVDSGNLRNGNSTKCQDCAKATRPKRRSTHGHTRGGSPTKSYYAWQGIKSRTQNPKDKRYADYGGRGIDMSPAWSDSFEAFLSDMGEPPSPKHQIDRIDNDRGYWPDNCKWSDLYEQGANKRNNVIIEWRGKSQTLAQWCRDLDLPYHTIKRRVLSGETDPDMILYKGRKPRRRHT